MFRMMLGLALVFTLFTPALADTTWLPLLQAGDDERTDGLGCQEPAFLAGVASSELHLRAGGNGWGCSSEFAASLEFDLSSIPVGMRVFQATLTVRKTGYADDSIGFFPLGVYAYPATGSPVAVTRASLVPETALDVVSPSSPNVDHSFDVTETIQDLVDDGEERVGLLLASVFNEAGYHDFIYLGGASHAAAPRLVVEHEGTVATQRRSWSRIKALFH